MTRYAILILIVAMTHAQANPPVFQNFVDAKKNGSEPILPDFSYAGYRYNEEALPNPDLKVFNVRDYGATANGKDSDEAAIKRAIAAAEDNGSGIVYFPHGHYMVNTTPEEQDSYILIQSSNIILRGDGPNKTVVEIKERAGDKAIRAGIYKFRFQRVADHAVAFKHASVALRTEAITEVVADARRETFCVRVKDASELAVDQWVTLGLPPTGRKDVKAFFFAPYEIPPRRTDPWKWFQGLFYLSERHQIKAIDGNVVTFREPIHVPVVADHGWQIRTFPHLENVGIEGIHFKGNWKGVYVGNYKLLYEKKSHSILMMSACVDSWIRNCRFSQYNMGMRLYRMTRCTLLDIEMAGTESNRGRHNIFLQESNGVLVAKLHDTQENQDGVCVCHASSGNVFWRCSNHPKTPMDLHAAFPYANLYDNVKSSLKRKPGSGAGKGNCPQHLGKLVLWNHHYTGSESARYGFWDKNLYEAKHQFYVMPIVVGMHGNPISFDPNQCEVLESPGQPVTPESLFEAQLKLRLGRVPRYISALK